MNHLRRGRPRERVLLDEIPNDFRTSVSYIDTICFLQSMRFPENSLTELCAARPGQDSRYVCRDIPTSDGFWVRICKLHQPTSAELFFLHKEEQNRRCRVTQVHVALDLLAHPSRSPDSIRQYVEARLVPNARARRAFRNRGGDLVDMVTTCGETTYYHRGVSQGIEIALYSDKHSKTGHGWQCCHLEYRVKGARALRAAGIQSMNGVRLLNHTEFWGSQLTFWRPPTFEDLARASNRAAKSRTADSLGTQLNQREAHLMLRLASPQGPDALNAMQLYLELRDRSARYNKRPSRLFQQVDHSWALPPDKNHIWPARRQLVD